MPAVPALPPNVRAARAHKRRVVAEMLQSSGAPVTDAEVGDHLAFEQQCIAAAWQGPGVAGPVPQWFATAVAGALAPIHASLAIIENNQAVMTAKLHNLAGERWTDPLQPVPNGAGLLPPPALRFPANRNDFRRLTGLQLSALLAFYGQPVPRRVPERRAMLRITTGIRSLTIE